jgi:hypothetical protein
MMAATAKIFFSLISDLLGITIIDLQARMASCAQNNTVYLAQNKVGALLRRLLLLVANQAYSLT